MGYVLREGLNYCSVGERTIFLDLVSGRYFALSAERHRAFQRWSMRESPLVDDLRKLGKLASEGILIATEADDHARKSSALMATSPEKALDPNNRPVKMRAIANAITARMLWARRVRRWPLADILDELGADKRERKQETSTMCGEEFAEVVQACEMTDIIFGKHDRCLERSLALAATCRAKGLKSELVIGVQTNPFAAHCWVQSGAFVLNETPDRARLFTPILVA